MILNNGFCEMSQEEVMLIDGGDNVWDWLAEGFGNAFGVKDVTAKEVTVAAGQVAGDIVKEIRELMPWNWF